MTKVLDLAQIRADILREPDEDGDEGEPQRPAWQRYGVKTMGGMLRRLWQQCGDGPQQLGLSTGNAQLDKLIGGYRREYITVLGARTSWGKSSFAIMALDEADRLGKRVLLVSGEDSDDMVIKRIAARRGPMNALKLRNVDLDTSEKSLLLGLADKAGKARPWFLDGRGKSSEFLAKMIRALCREEHYELVVIDYLQAFTAKAQDRRNEVSMVARLFADSIKTGGAAGLLLSQIKRLETGREPSMHDLKESGDVENLAEHVIIGGSKTGPARQIGPEVTTRYLTVPKNKDGPKSAGRVWLDFDDGTASFRTSTKTDDAPDADDGFGGL